MKATQYVPISTAQGELLPLRLAIRRQGAFMHAFLADGPTMRDALPLGTLHSQLYEAHPNVAREWEATMQAAVSAMLAHFGARQITWLESPAERVAA